MFSFMKKDKEKKKDGKKQTSKDPAGAGGIGGTSQEKLTSDDLLRLDEVRRSLKIKSRRREKEKLPSGITADYTAHLGKFLTNCNYIIKTLSMMWLSKRRVFN